MSLTGREAGPIPRSPLNGNSCASASDPGCWSAVQGMGVAEIQDTRSMSPDTRPREITATSAGAPYPSPSGLTGI